MVIAFILINLESTDDRKTLKKIADLKETIYAHPLLGEYDIIAKLENESFNHIGQLVIEQVRTLPGVVDTKTLAVVDFRRQE